MSLHHTVSPTASSAPRIRRVAALGIVAAGFALMAAGAASAQSTAVADGSGGFAPAGRHSHQTSAVAISSPRFMIPPRDRWGLPEESPPVCTFDVHPWAVAAVGRDPANRDRGARQLMHARDGAYMLMPCFVAHSPWDTEIGRPRSQACA